MPAIGSYRVAVGVINQIGFTDKNCLIFANFNLRVFTQFFSRTKGYGYFLLYLRGGRICSDLDKLRSGKIQQNSPRADCRGVSGTITDIDRQDSAEIFTAGY
jgi:hypothetical protein